MATASVSAAALASAFVARPSGKLAAGKPCSLRASVKPSEGVRCAAVPSRGSGGHQPINWIAPSAADFARIDNLNTMAAMHAEMATGDPMQMLLKERIVFLGGQVDDLSADFVISQLLLLDSQDSTDIRLFINSPGGSVTAGMGIYDAMQLCKADVSTVCFGLAASMGAFLLSAGQKGKRFAMPNSRIMVHQPLGGISGQADDMEIQAKEILFHKENLQLLMALHTGQPVERIALDCDRDFYMSPQEAVKYGLIDGIISSKF